MPAKKKTPAKKKAPAKKAGLGGILARPVELNFPARLVQKPFIFDLVKKFNLVPNIRRANITHDFGYMQLELKGKVQDLEKALKYLKTAGVKVSPIEKDVMES
jgi:ABC-type methionine transport system ATPase subunit